MSHPFSATFAGQNLAAVDHAAESAEKPVSAIPETGDGNGSERE